MTYSLDLMYSIFGCRINVSVQLPQLKKSGAKISNWEVIFILWENVDYANMYQASQPFEWLKLRWWRRSRRWLVHTHSLFSRFQNPRLSSSGEHKKVLNFVETIEKPWNLCRFECEIENYSSMEHVLAKLDMKTVKLSGFQVSITFHGRQFKQSKTILDLL